MSSLIRSPDQDLLFSFLKGIDTPRSLGLWLRFKYDGFQSIRTFSFRPSDYADPVAFHLDYTAISFIKKMKGFSVRSECRAAALLSFTTSETRCKTQNEFIRALNSGTAQAVDRTFEASVFLMRRYISRVLGSRTSLALRDCKWTTGANVDLRRSASFPDTKLEVPISTTRRAQSYLIREMSHDPHWFYSFTGVMPSGPYSVIPSTVVKTVEGGRYDTVSKTSFTDRSIIVEPRANSLLQKGVGTYIRRRLLRFGVDLNDQGVNQRLAAKAFKSQLCTIDLEAASDSISREVVALLLPPDWYSLLDDLRSSKVSINGSFSSLEKFSSMGNGFTFELESLIFAAAVYAVTLSDLGESSSVYGDDIIVPKSVSAELINLLKTLGFSVNTEKTFVEGSFFESCGKHFFGDYDVTPIYQKEALDDVEAIRLHNRLYRFARRAPYIAARLRSAVEFIKRKFPRYFRSTFAPDFYDSDDAVLCPPNSLTFDRNRGYRSSRIRVVCKDLPGNESAMFAYTLRQSLSAESATYGYLRTKKGRWKESRFYVNKFGV